MTVLIDVQPMELLEILIDKERLAEARGCEAERRHREAEDEAADQ